MKQIEICSQWTYFHVSCNDVMEILNFRESIEAKDPNTAISKMIDKLPIDWEGSIEINDHSTMRASDMPLIDFCRTPMKKINTQNG